MFDIKKITSPHEVDCGPTCLQMLLDYYGIDVPLEQLISECNLKINGCTAADVKRVGNQHGLDMCVYKMTADEVISQDRPSIVWWRGNHFCVCCGVDVDGRVMIANPDRGKYRMKQDTFAALYTGVALFNGEPVTLEEQPTLEDRIEARLLYLELMTGLLDEEE